MYTEVSSKANLVFDQVDAVQSYVRQTLRPKMFAYLPREEFIIEAMSSSYVTRKVMGRAEALGQGSSLPEGWPWGPATPPRN